MRGESWRHKSEAPKRYESLGDCKNLSVFPGMQSQIAFVFPRRPQLVSVAEFDDEPICLFAGIEIIIGAAYLRCRSFKLTRFYFSRVRPKRCWAGPGMLCRTREPHFSDDLATSDDQFTVVWPAVLR